MLGNSGWVGLVRVFTRGFLNLGLTDLFGEPSIDFRFKLQGSWTLRVEFRALDFMGFGNIGVWGFCDWGLKALTF